MSAKSRVFGRLIGCTLLVFSVPVFGKMCFCTAVYFGSPDNSPVYFDDSCHYDAIDFEETDCDGLHFPAAVSLYSPGAYERCVRVASSNSFRLDNSFPGGSMTCREKRAGDDSNTAIRIRHYIAPGSQQSASKKPAPTTPAH